MMLVSTLISVVLGASEERLCHCRGGSGSHPLRQTEANSCPQSENVLTLSTQFPEAGSNLKNSRGAHSLGI